MKLSAAINANRQPMGFRADVIGLLSAHVISFPGNVVPAVRIVSANPVPEIGCNRFL